jgi:hypothetical protein
VTKWSPDLIIQDEILIQKRMNCRLPLELSLQGGGAKDTKREVRKKQQEVVVAAHNRKGKNLDSYCDGKEPLMTVS